MIFINIIFKIDKDIIFIKNIKIMSIQNYIGKYKKDSFISIINHLNKTEIKENYIIFVDSNSYVVKSINYDNNIITCSGYGHIEPGTYTIPISQVTAISSEPLNRRSSIKTLNLNYVGLFDLCYYLKPVIHELYENDNEMIQEIKELKENVKRLKEQNEELIINYQQLLVNWTTITEYMKRIDKMEEYMPYKIEEKRLRQLEEETRMYKLHEEEMKKIYPGWPADI